jgi:hypothetical protein
MSADKIPALRELMTPSEWAQTEAFPSVLRLLYAGPLRRELRENLHRADAIASITFHRVIDNEPITMSGEDLWIALNYQLIHLVDFLPVANWSVHQNDTSFILFRDLYDLLEGAGKREAIVGLHAKLAPSQAGGRAPGRGRLAHHADPGECQRADGGQVGHPLLGAHRALPRLPDRLGLIRPRRFAALKADVPGRGSTTVDPGRKVPTPTTMAEGDKHDEEDASHDRRRRCRRPRCSRSGSGAAEEDAGGRRQGLDNPFFTVLGDGCALWNKENPKSEYTCLYTGPASSADEAGEVQIVEDLINKGVAGIAISPSNAPAMANMLKAKKPKMPIMTIDADLAAADRALRSTYLGTNNYDMGVLMAKHPEGAQAQGRHGVPAAGQRRGRQHQCPRRRVPRHDLRQEGRRQARPATAAGPRSPVARCSRTTRSTSRTSRWPTSSPRTRSSTPSSSSAAGRSSGRRRTRR